MQDELAYEAISTGLKISVALFVVAIPYLLVLSVVGDQPAVVWLASLLYVPVPFVFTTYFILGAVVRFQREVPEAGLRE